MAHIFEQSSHKNIDRSSFKTFIETTDLCVKRGPLVVRTSMDKMQIMLCRTMDIHMNWFLEKHVEITANSLYRVIMFYK